MFEFQDRADAGRRLARKLAGLHGRNVIVLGLPRGGVPVAFEVARALRAPLDVIVVRKLGVPFQPEVAMGAIGEGNSRVLDSPVLALSGVGDEELEAVEKRERRVLEARVLRYRRGRPRKDLRGRTAVIVDDGIATGSTARVACQVARKLGAAEVVLAVPVAAAGVLAGLDGPDEVVCLQSPRDFQAVGYYYRDFTPTEDEEVEHLLDAADRWLLRPGVGDTAGNGGSIEEEIEIPDGPVRLQGTLHLPAQCRGIVIFAHGSGSGRHSPRNRFVASILQDAGLGTVLLDLLTPREEFDRKNVFDIELLAARLTAATRWLGGRDDTSSCRIGFFGASTGAGAALWAAAGLGDEIAAVVSRGGRPDLAAARLGAVRAPTLLIVGSADTEVLALNRQAMALMHAPVKLETVAGASHLFVEPGTLAQAARLAAAWFRHYLLASGEDRAAQ
ncbi:phosphoribosyltransferase family protein [Arthrobacter silvisoli]|uniref:phosphoribosyltransferase family protein n=1 Tax=Arthrobacter silvisoli TaxID=2291022 RepID=UPI000E20D4D7|nr:phosphoribosyltransferase family protein [Arthrobacter silvisoli]